MWRSAAGEGDELMKLSREQLGRLILEYDPAHPQPEFFATATEMAVALAHSVQTEPVPFPAGLAPHPVAPSRPPAREDPLPRADVLLVTWTVAEAEAMATIFTAGVSLDEWFEYTHNVASFIPKVTGNQAPFNSTAPRYRHSLGLYYVVDLVGKKVLCFKSGLHMAYDGPAVPVVDLWKQIIEETRAALVITTGTGGAIGANVLLGDVVVAAQTVFDCTGPLQHKPFKSASYNTSPLRAAPDVGLTAAMLTPNADRLKASGVPLHPDGRPAFFYAGSQIPSPKIVSTDRFAFDNTTNTEGLQPLGNICDMGDATLGLFASTAPHPPRWVAIRNASDPQVDGSLTPARQAEEARTIYMHYGPFTTAASLLASWAVICGEFAPAPGPPAATMAAAPPSRTRLVAKATLRQKQVDPSYLLLQIAASTSLTAADVSADQVPPATLDALTAHLSTINVNPATSDLVYRTIAYTDEGRQARQLHLIHVRNREGEPFIGTYLYSGADLAAKEEFVSS